MRRCKVRSWPSGNRPGNCSPSATRGDPGDLGDRKFAEQILFVIPIEYRHRAERFGGTRMSSYGICSRMPTGGVAKQRRWLERRESVLDAVLEEANDLGGKLGKDDRGRLKQYLASVREVETRIQRANK
jgi:hypothetical protein